MQFLVIAFDGKDREAPMRRAAARPTHLEYIKRLKAAGRFISGGPILSDDGKGAIGSAMIFDAATRGDVEAILAGDPYTTQGVLKEMTILAVKF